MSSKLVWLAFLPHPGFATLTTEFPPEASTTAGTAFAPVVDMIMGLVVTIAKDQDHDNMKNQFCSELFDSHSVAAIGAALDAAKAGLSDAQIDINDIVDNNTTEHNITDDLDSGGDVRESRRESTTGGLSLQQSQKMASESNRANAETKAIAEVMAILTFVRSLHENCDWFVQYFNYSLELRTHHVHELLQAKVNLEHRDPWRS